MKVSCTVLDWRWRERSPHRPYEGSTHNMTLVQTTTTTRAHSMFIPIPQVEPRITIPPQNLRIPGPTSVPPKVLAELAAR